MINCYIKYILFIDKSWNSTNTRLLSIYFVFTFLNKIKILEGFVWKICFWLLFSTKHFLFLVGIEILGAHNPSFCFFIACIEICSTKTSVRYRKYASCNFPFANFLLHYTICSKLLYSVQFAHMHVLRTKNYAKKKPRVKNSGY